MRAEVATSLSSSNLLTSLSTFTKGAASESNYYCTPINSLTSDSLTTLFFLTYFLVMRYFSSSFLVLASTFAWGKNNHPTLPASGSNFQTLTTRAFSPSLSLSSNRSALRVESGSAYSQKPNPTQNSTRKSFPSA